MASRMSEWLGLHHDPESDEIPSWQGASKRQKWMSIAFWFTVAGIMYVFLDARMPAEDGIGGTAPVYLALLSGLAGLNMTERSFLRNKRCDQ